jgi:hypothetical protein
VRAWRAAKDYLVGAVGRLVQVFPIEMFNQMIARVAPCIDRIKRGSVTRMKAQIFSRGSEQS